MSQISYNWTARVGAVFTFWGSCVSHYDTFPNGARGLFLGPGRALSVLFCGLGPHHPGTSIAGGWGGGGGTLEIWTLFEP